MLASTLERYLTGTSGDEKYLGQVPHRYLEQKSLKLLQSIKPLQEWRVGVMPGLKGSCVNTKMFLFSVSNTCFTEKSQS